MPQMGADMTEGTLLRWLKQEGDSVKRGEIIAEIETDKANVEIEAFANGVLRNITTAEGEVVQVGEVMAVIAAEGEEMKPAASAPAKNGAAPASPTDESKKPGEARPDVEPGGEVDEEEAAVGRGEAGEEAIIAREESEAAADRGEQSAAAREDRAESSGSRGGAAREEGRLKASPVARRVARENDVDLASVNGSGPEGRIVRRDVEAALETARARPEPEQGPRPLVAPEPAAEAEAQRGKAVAMTRMRSAIARRMSQSKQEAPHFYVTVDVDMTLLMDQRKRLNETLDEESTITVNDLLVKASAVTLRRFERFNAHFRDGSLVVLDDVNVCIGVALPDGLIAPSIANCDRKSLVEIAKASKHVVGRAREGRLFPSEFDGSFTITNLGAYGVETLIGIINPPQVAILGVGRVQPTPVVRDGEIVVAQMMKLALSADHRAVDGANGGEFVAHLQTVLENPLLLV